MQDAQKKVDKWVNKYAEGYWSPHEILARLVEEVGELAREINHTYGPKKKKKTETSKRIEEELADIVFTVSALANSLDIDLDKSFNKVVSKYNKRDEKRWKMKK